MNKLQFTLDKRKEKVNSLKFLYIKLKKNLILNKIYNKQMIILLMNKKYINQKIN